MGGITDQARKDANLRLLQRSCLREINDIVLTATHVVLYEFVCDEWRKCNVEGSMFLSQTPTQYYLIILNRHSTENMQMEVTATMQLQHQDPYLIFRERVGDATRIRGVWFHSAEERLAMTAELQKSIDWLHAGNLPRPPPPSASPRVPLPATPMASSRGAPSLTSPAPEPSYSSSGVADLEPLLASVAISAAAQVAATATPGMMTTPNSARGAAAQSPASSSSPLPAAAGLTGNGGAGVALDKKSLQLALLSLIQDDRFLDLLHSQYLRVVHARVKKQQQNTPHGNSNTPG